MAFQTMSGIPKVTSTANFYSNTNPLLQSRGIGGFAQPSALFGAGEQGAWWDFSDLANMWQDSDGATPAALESPVGFVLDKRLNQGMRGVELAYPVTSNANWGVQNSGVLTSDGASLTITNGIAAEGAANFPGGVVNAWYEIIITTGPGSGGVVIFPGGARLGLSANNTQRFVAQCTSGSGTIALGTNSGAQGVSANYKSISVKSLGLGNHLVQPTAGARPTLSKRYNLAVSSGDLGGAGWTNHDAANLTLSGTGNILNKGNNTPSTGFYEDLVAQGNQNYTLTILAKAGSAGTVALTIKDRLSDTVRTNTVFQVGNDGSVKTFQITGTTAGASTGVRIEVGTGGVVGDVTILGVDVRLTADAALAIPQYQRTGSIATDYDTLGFPAYLLFDGATKWMQSASTVDMSAFNQLSAFWGCSKLSEATVGIIAEANSTGNGTYTLDAPRGAGNNNYGIDARNAAGTVSDTAIVAGNGVPTTDVLYGQIDLSQAVSIASQVQLQINGANPGNTNSGTGPITVQNLTSDVAYVGARAGTSLFFNGRMFGLILRATLNSITNANDSLMVQKWLGSKCGKFF